MPSQTFELKSRIIKAGAGTGKTTCLTQEVFRILQGFKDQFKKYPSLIVCTFTRKATQELKQKLYKEAIQKNDRELLAHISSPLVHISTIHGILTLFLKSHGYKYGFGSSNFEPENIAAENHILNRVAADLLFGKYLPLLEKAPFPILTRALRFYTKTKLTTPHARFFSEKDLKETIEKDQILTENEENPILPEQQTVSNFFNKCRKEEPDCFKTEAFAQFFQDFKPLAEEFSEEFLKQKKQNGLITMEDLELWSLDLLNHQLETGRLFSEDWNYWFIDEYQDTSWVQEQILQKITGFKNVFCVGDPQQSIYQFREADPEVFARRVKNCKGTVGTLATNYRSKSPLIRFFNDFFPKEKGFIPLSPSKEKTAETDENNPPVYFIYYDIYQSDLNAQVFETRSSSCSVFPGKTELPRNRESEQNAPEISNRIGVNTSLQEKNNEVHFKEAVYFQIQRLLKKGNLPGDITILGMKNEHLSLLARFLRQKKLPVRIHSSRGFAENRLILDALFLLKFLINPHDDENLLALCRTPYFRISDGELVKRCEEWKEFQTHEENNIQPTPGRKDPIKGKNQPKKNLSAKQNKSRDESKFLSASYPTNNKSHLIKEEEKQTFSPSLWSFLQEKHTSQEIIQTLKTYKNLTQEQGFLATFEQALFERGLMDLTDFQDPSGVSESHLWNLLAQMRDSQRARKHPLEIFYSLMKGEDTQISSQEALPEKTSNFIQLMTIHSSKGLQFKNVIVFDLTKRLTFNSTKEDCVFDRERGLMAFSIPLEGRDQKSVKCYAQKKYMENKKHQEIKEKDRLLYVALTRAKETVTLMIPLSKPPKHSWFERFPFFRELEISSPNGKRENSGKNPGDREKHKTNQLNSKNGKQTPAFSVKTGLHIRDNYCFLVEHNPVEKTAPPIKASSPPLLHPLKSSPMKQLCEKTAGDFVKDMTPAIRETGFILTKEQNIFFKTEQGRYLHDCLKLLSIHSLSALQKKISQRSFSQEEKNHFFSALRWISELKNPNMSHFLKTGFTEWPFQQKTNAVILRGRIDLWGWKDNVLWVFDYKSTRKASPAVFYQLAFYSYVLEQMCQPKQIIMCGLYPFAQKSDCVTYSKEHKQQVSHWISRQT